VTTLVVVPTLGRRPALLDKSLASIRSQDCPDLDLVAVAPEGRGVEDLVATYGGRFVTDPGSGGLSGALNAGLGAATPGTEYFAWLGDDDLLASGSLQATTCALDANPDAVMVFGWCDYIDEHDTVVFRSRAGRLAAATITFGPNLIPQPGSLFRYADVVAVGGLDESVKLAMDLDLFLRLRKRGRLLALRQTLASFRWHADSATVSGETASMEESDQLRMKYMPRPVAAAYRVLRWPGRWALLLAKRRVMRNTARAAARTQSSTTV
jgi:GT2 family glycosyltransferase